MRGLGVGLAVLIALSLCSPCASVAQQRPSDAGTGQVARLNADLKTSLATLPAPPPPPPPAGGGPQSRARARRPVGLCAQQRWSGGCPLAEVRSPRAERFRRRGGRQGRCARTRRVRVEQQSLALLARIRRSGFRRRPSGPARVPEPAKHG